VIVVDRGRLCSNESFMTVNREQHSVMCCNLLFYLLTWIRSKVGFSHLQCRPIGGSIHVPPWVELWLNILQVTLKLTFLTFACFLESEIIIFTCCIWLVQSSSALVQVEIIELYNDGSGLGFGIIGSKGIGVIIKTIIPGGVSDRVCVCVIL